MTDFVPPAKAATVHRILRQHGHPTLTKREHGDGIHVTQFLPAKVEIRIWNGRRSFDMRTQIDAIIKTLSGAGYDVRIGYGDAGPDMTCLYATTKAGA